MHATLTNSILFIAAAASCVHAINDWTVPCLQGDCSYDVSGSATSQAGSMRVWGPPDAISDITEAAGWMILDCEPNALDQNIRLVCQSADATAAGCDHLYQGGAEGTVVRLPQNCGKGPFALVKKAWVPADQSIPANIAKRLGKRESKATVKALSLSTDFKSAKSSKGIVNIAISGTTTGDRRLLEIPHASRRSFGRRNRVGGRRGFFDSIGSAFDSVKDAVGSAVGSVEDAAGAAADQVKDVAGKVAGAAADAASQVKGATDTVVDTTKDIASSVANAAQDVGTEVLDAVNGVNNVNKTFNGAIPPIDINKSLNIVNVSIDCGTIGQVKMSVDADTKAHAEVNFGIIVAGTLIPPKFDTFSLTTGLNADLNGALNFVASASTKPLDTGEITLFEVGIPGLDFPGILTIGPSFKIKGRASLAVDADVDMKVDLAYTVRNAVFTVPPSKDHPTSGSANPLSSPLKLSISPQTTANGTLSAHLIPTIDVGLNALAGTASASVFVNLDASANLNLALEAGTTVSKSIGGTEVSHATTSSPTSGGAHTSKMAVSTSSMLAKEDVPMSGGHHTMTTRTANGAQGCVDLTGGIAASAGAKGSFFGLFDANKKFPIFAKKFQIFQKCFGNAQLAKRSLPKVEAGDERQLVARADAVQLQCPFTAVPAAVSLVDETIESASIRALKN